MAACRTASDFLLFCSLLPIFPFLLSSCSSTLAVCVPLFTWPVLLQFGQQGAGSVVLVRGGGRVIVFPASPQPPFPVSRDCDVQLAGRHVLLSRVSRPGGQGQREPPSRTAQPVFTRHLLAAHSVWMCSLSLC